MFQGFFSKEKIVLGVLILVLFMLVSFIFFRFQLASMGIVSAKQLYSGMQKSFSPSTANITLVKNDLKIVLKITSADNDSFKAFLKNAGIENFGEQEISVELGDSTAEFIDKLFRENNLISDDSKSVSLNLRVLSKEIDFDNERVLSYRNKKIFGPFDSTSESLLENPSAVGSIRTQVLGESGYLVEIDNPEKVIADSTLSGRLKLSDKLIGSGWWQVLTKLAKINLRIEKGKITGEVYLK